ncbi:MAG: hypothetical protein KatS3mg039_0655 [Candidatus Kapaibacterium sp.]|nr:MAG: hypothetical protein KatS3mg039_0655 [Candidatus Kapabacteria bacterium]
MKTLRLDASNPADVATAGALLRAGKLVAIPTETVYGLAACADDATAIAEIFCVKGRPLDNPLIVHCQAPEEIELVATDIPPIAWQLLERFAPGPLTLVLKRRQDVPALISAGLPTVAVRIPSPSVTRQLIAHVGTPLVAPSANRSGRPSPTCAAHVLEDLDGHIAAVLDAGPCPIGIESTVLLLVGDITIARPGAITAADLATVLGFEPPLLGPSSAETPCAPGMKYRHYAPAIPVILLESPDQLPQSTDANIVVLATQPLDGRFVVRPLQPATLYDEFRRAEREGRTALYVLVTEDIRSNAALMNRLQKAATSTHTTTRNPPTDYSNRLPSNDS